MNIEKLHYSWSSGILFLWILLLFVGCEKATKGTAEVESTVIHPDWSKDANIYEVNIRQYTEEGTFNAFREHLPRLQRMGVEILWLMPIHPIGEKNRKGSLGSYYSVKDYKAVNPNFGTLKDLKALVDEAHERGMKVILDWVANHTAWDHHWTEEHPEWYTKDEEGNFKPPVENWSDVIELDFSKQEMRDRMVEALKYWVVEADIDGYRCDVAGMVPTGFWERVRSELDGIKPVFMLAEANEPDHHNKAFDMSYAWDFHFLLNDVASGNKPLSAIDEQMRIERKKFGANDFRLMFTSNHDENSWKGTVFERMGDNVKVAAVLAATIHGMPLIYSGQEAGLNKRLAFFEKDRIDWKERSLEEFYAMLLKLKKENKALWNGKNGGDFEKITTDHPEEIYAYRRVKEDNEVLVLLNFSDRDQQVTLTGLDEQAEYADLITGRFMTMGEGPVSLDAHGYLILHR